MRTVFFGTPAIAVPALRALHETTTVAAVVCQPDRPSGRGLSLTPPAVKVAAAGLGLPVLQPVKVRDGELSARLRGLATDVAVVMAYGRILPEDVLIAPRAGCVNLHASLLPRYRGAAPIQWAVIRGETATGVSLMQMDAGMDTGAVYTTRSLAIGPDETAGELAERLAALAAQIVREDLAAVVAGAVVASPQDPALATYAPPIRSADAVIDWSRSAAEVHALVRGMSPAPGARTAHRSGILKVHALALVPAGRTPPPGVVSVCDQQVLVGTGAGAVELLRAQCEGRRPQSAADLVNGRALRDGERLGG